MNCECGSDTNVKDTRTIEGSTAKWRRRQCKTCSAIFTTMEQVVETLPTKRSKPAGQYNAPTIELAQIKLAPLTKVVAVKAAPIPLPPVDEAARTKVERLREERMLAKLDDY